MSRDFLAKRVVADFTSAFRKNHIIDEFGFIHLPEQMVNKSPVKVEGNKLGVETWCMKIVLPYIHRHLLLQRCNKDKSTVQAYSRVALLLNPECATFWNIRKELIQRGYLSGVAELKFTNIILTCHPKSPETFIHKRWVLKYTLSKLTDDGSAANNHVNNLISSEVQTALRTEIAGCCLAASRYPSNYNAWSHRIWIIQMLAKSSMEVLQSELLQTKLWVRQHVSDHSGFQYRQFLLRQLSHTSLLVEELCNEFQFIGELLMNYPGHEAVWNHRRALFHLALEKYKSTYHLDYHIEPEIAVIKPKMARLQEPVFSGEESSVDPSDEMCQKNSCLEPKEVTIATLSELANVTLELHRVNTLLESVTSSDFKLQESFCKRYIEWLHRFQT